AEPPLQREYVAPALATAKVAGDDFDLPRRRPRAREAPARGAHDPQGDRPGGAGPEGQVVTATVGDPGVVDLPPIAADELPQLDVALGGGLHATEHVVVGERLRKLRHVRTEPRGHGDNPRRRVRWLEFAVAPEEQPVAAALAGRGLDPHPAVRVRLVG